MRIQGLTERQVELLDIMWAIEEYTELEEWMETLDSQERKEAEALQRLVVLETFEELLDKGSYPDARRVLVDIMSK
jgi:predicted transcriptional regulator